MSLAPTRSIVPADGVRPLSLCRPSPAKGRQQSRWELAAVHRLNGACRVDNGSGDGRERVVAEGFEDVAAAFEQLARERKARAVPADPGGELLVVAAVGAGGEPGALSCLI